MLRGGKMKIQFIVAGVACALMAVPAAQSQNVDVNVGRRGGVNVEIGKGRHGGGGVNVEIGGRRGEGRRGDRDFRRDGRGDRGGRVEWGNGRGGSVEWGRGDRGDRWRDDRRGHRNHRRHARGWHRDWRPHQGWHHNYVWKRSHRPRWVYSGYSWPAWYWITTPRGYWQCTAFDQYMNDYSEVGSTEDQAAYNALAACGDFGDCYIPSGYCQFRR